MRSSVNDTVNKLFDPSGIPPLLPQTNELASFFVNVIQGSIAS